MHIELPPDSRAWIEVSLTAIRRNIEALQNTLGPSIHIMAVVKANAYGHGLVPVAREMLSAGAAWLGVASVGEGVALRTAGVQAPIALLCAANPAEAPAIVAHRLTVAIGDHAILEAMIAAREEIAANHFHTAQDTPQAEPVLVHLEIDTGIGRSGVLPGEALALWQRARQADIPITGLTTHFADAEGVDAAFTRHQQTVFQQTRAELERAGASFTWVHLDNSAATLRFCDVACNLVRPGLLLYGITPSLPASTAVKLTPVLSLKARVATVRDLPAGHPISYGLTHRLTRPSRVATVLIGYGDGYPRRASNRGYLLLHGRQAPILGRVCMDQTVVDVTDIPNVQPGDEAVCIGAQGEERITAEQLAALIETTEHEITTDLSARLPRLYNAG